jgi:hypothetical protein
MPIKMQVNYSYNTRSSLNPAWTQFPLLLFLPTIIESSWYIFRCREHAITNDAEGIFTFASGEEMLYGYEDGAIRENHIDRSSNQSIAL